MWSANHLKKAKPFMIHDGGLLMLVSNSVDVIFIGQVRGTCMSWLRVTLYTLQFCDTTKMAHAPCWRSSHLHKGTICMPID